ncbi:MAG: efflux RND transporter permease subunit, partial [Planctomycetia bacterium]|nr:efflux RND transporter permease subunit [Planctomycetia bacterium]
MLSGVIEWSLANRAMVIALAVLMAVGGLSAATRIPVDAVPDLVNIQVQVVTEAGTLSPLEVERYITYPVELAVSGLPAVEEIRSISRFGISLVTIVFHEGTDIFRARQLVAERLPEAKSRMSLGGADPQLGTLSTALGEILQFEVKGTRSPMELRSLLEWEIAPAMREVSGVTDINSHGGYAKSYEVRIDPDRMASHGISLGEVLAALERNNDSTGGGYIVKNGEQRFIRGQALLGGSDDIERVVVRSPPGGVPVLVRTIADVTIGPLVRQGAATRDGRGEVVTGMVMMVRGENSRRVVAAAKEKLAAIRGTLPEGVDLEILYDRSDLIARTLDTVLHNLAEGGLLVIGVLLVLLGNVRAGLIVSLAIPLSMLFAANLMWATGISASLMSLGAIDFGLVVDSSVIMVENCVRRLGLAPPSASKLDVVRDAAIEVRGPTMFGELIIAIVYLPILMLEGTEGKLFRPMALTVLFALAGSLILSLTLMPVLAATVLSREEEHEPLVMRLFHRLYHPVVRQAVHHPVVVSLCAAALVAASVPIAARLGAEFMPRLDEGDILIEVNRLPSATLEDSVPLTTRIETVLGQFPEVRTVFSKTGRPEIANDIMGVQQTDVWVMLEPRGQWPADVSRDDLVERMSTALASAVPGANFSFSQPIEMRVDELVAGVKADVAVLLYGDDLGTLGDLGKQIEGVLRGIPGAADVRADWQANVPTLRIDARPDQLARHGIDGVEVMRTVSAMGGIQAGVIFEGRPRYPLVVKFPRAWREDDALVPQIPVGSAGGRPVPLGELADIRMEESPPSIEHENSRRRSYVSANVRGRDVAGFVAEAREAIARQVRLPAGYALGWGGDFENLISASRRLALITPLVLGLIAMLLYSSFKSFRLASLIFCAVPVAASGGVAALAMREMPFSVAAGVGFVALFGVAVLNGLVWV